MRADGARETAARPEEGGGVAPTAAVQPEPHSQRVKTGRRELATTTRRLHAVNGEFPISVR
jgi:hypothetical protein